jgi:hypothetical protein
MLDWLKTLWFFTLYSRALDSYNLDFTYIGGSSVVDSTQICKVHTALAVPNKRTHTVSRDTPSSLYIVLASVRTRTEAQW